MAPWISFARGSAGRVSNLFYPACISACGSCRGRGGWVDGYIEYMEKHAPRDYETLKRLWLRATGRQRSLFDYIPRI